MDFRKLPLLVLGCLTVAGCRHDPYMDAYFEMLNAEKRVLEDQLYETQYNYEKALKELESCRAKGATDETPRPRVETEAAPPPAEEPDLPSIELPPGLDGEASRRSNEKYRPVGTGVLPSRPESMPSDKSGVPGRIAVDTNSAKPIDQSVAAIHLNARRTGGMELDGQPGDDALSVLIEPRNAQGQFVARSAAISIVLLDPLQRGEEARFARWDFDRETTRRMLKPDGLDRGLYVRVPWPDVPPDVERLHLFVRYAADDGRVVEADREILVRPPDLIADRWTPRADSPPARTARRAPPSPPAERNPHDDALVLPANHESSPPDKADAPGTTPVQRLDYWTPAR